MVPTRSLMHWNVSINKLFASCSIPKAYKQQALDAVKTNFDTMRSFTKDLFTMFEEKVILAQGELMSTTMMNLYLNENGL